MKLDWIPGISWNHFWNWRIFPKKSRGRRGIFIPNHAPFEIQPRKNQDTFNLDVFKDPVTKSSTMFQGLRSYSVDFFMAEIRVLVHILKKCTFVVVFDLISPVLLMQALWRSVGLLASLMSILTWNDSCIKRANEPVKPVIRNTPFLRLLRKPSDLVIQIVKFKVVSFKGEDGDWSRSANLARKSSEKYKTNQSWKETMGFWYINLWQ